MQYISEILYHWWSNNNCLTRDFLITNIFNLLENELLWETDLVSYKIYRKEIRRVQRRYKVRSLDFLTERNLIKLKCQGDSEALLTLFYSHLSFVINIAKKYQNHGLLLNDLISEGNIGLWGAIQKIENQNYRLLTYASSSIKGRILNAIDKNGTQIHYPSNVLVAHRKIENVTNTLKLQTGCSPSTEELSELCKIDSYLFDKALHNHYYEISIERIHNFIPDYDSLDNFLGYCYQSVDEDCYMESLSFEVDRALRQLYDREREVVKMYFGIGCKEMSLEEIAHKLDLTRERVRQIKEKSIRKLKGQRSKLLKQFLG